MTATPFRILVLIIALTGVAAVLSLLVKADKPRKIRFAPGTEKKCKEDGGKWRNGKCEFPGQYKPYTDRTPPPFKR